MDLKFRTLKAEEIECRPQQVNTDNYWCILLLYKDARSDMSILDEVVTPMNWESDFQVINGNLFAEVRIYDDEKQIWVSKKDVGVESNTEKEKGQASDAFKRACVKWGIGRELYTAPFIIIKLTENDLKVGKNNSKQLKTKFRVGEVGYDNFNKINSLVIIDDSGEVRYKLGENIKPQQTKKSEKDDALLDTKKSEFRAYITENNLIAALVAKTFSITGKSKVNDYQNALDQLKKLDEKSLNEFKIKGEA